VNQQNLQFEYVEPSLLKPNPWNTNRVTPENQKKLEASIEKLGMFKPILVRTLGDGSMEILGGQHRVELALKRKMSEVPIINVGFIDDVKAKEIGLVDNGRYGADDTLALAELLESLGETDLSFLPYSDAEMNSIFASIDIDLSELEIEDSEEEIPEKDPTERPLQTHQIIRFKVPVDDAHLITDAIENIINQQGFDSTDSLERAGDALVQMFKEWGEK